MTKSTDKLEPQPLLPRFGTLWFFVVAIIVALAMFVIRAAEQGQALAAAMAFTVLFLAVTALFSGAAFLVAFLVGAMERAAQGEQTKTSSPFIDGSLPEQLIPPKPPSET